MFQIIRDFRGNILSHLPTYAKSTKRPQIISTSDYTVLSDTLLQLFVDVVEKAINCQLSTNADGVGAACNSVISRK